MKKHLQRLFAVFLAALFAVAAFPFGAIAVEASVMVMEHSLDETTVMFDLENMELQKSNGQKEKINLSDFPLDSTLNETTEYVEVISLYEKGFTKEEGINSPNYGLYLYIYNPSGKKFSAFGNQANMATAYGEATGGNIYNLIDLQLLSQSEDGRFVKFKVRKTNGQFPCVLINEDGVDSRSYDIGSLTLSYEENRKSYKVAMSGFYSGFEADNTLTFRGKEIDVLGIEVHHTSYLLDSSPLGDGHRSALNSCYFAIPESIIQRSGQLTGVKAEWYEYKTNPIPIFANKNDYDYYSQFTAKDLSKEDDFHLGFGYAYSGQVDFLAFDYFYGEFPGYRGIDKIQYKNNGDFKYMPTVFYNPKASQYGNDLLVKGEDLLTDLRLNSSQFVRGLKTQIAALEKKEDLGVFEVLELEAARSQLYGKNGNYYSGFFQDVVDDGRQKGYNVIDAKASTPIDLKSFEGDRWAKLMEYGISYPDVNNSVTYPTIESIRDIVHDTSHSLGVNQRDLEELKNYSEKMEVFGYRPYIFRFAVTDLHYGNVAIKKSNFINLQPCETLDGIYFSQTVFLDFQVIEMTFTKEHEQTTIDTRYTVVSDPEDVTPDVEQRPEEDNNLISDAGIGALGLLKDTAASSLNWLGDFLFGNDAFSIIKKVIGVIVIILLVRFVLIPVIRWLFSKIKKKDKPEKTIAVNETKKDTEKKE